ncbi:unnamed protein product [Rhodiola kirilowii]
MEVLIRANKSDQQIDLPPGFRFHPTDEELITHYLCEKIRDGLFVALAIGEADLNKCEPWDLPAKAKMGENEWYFFCLRDKKYPTGLRTNRATEAGYWKATGKDKEIFRGNVLIGMKKTLVFYRGRAPKGDKSNWVMHEYRLEGKLSLHNLPQTAKTEWAISRVFEKSSNGKKIHDGLSSFDDFMAQAHLPPLMDFSQSETKLHNFSVAASPNVSCFSNYINFPRAQHDQLFGVSTNQPNPFSGFNQSNTNLFMPGNYLDNNCWPNPSMQIKSGREKVSVSQETGLTTDVNVNINSNEISSVMSNLATGMRRGFEEGCSGSGVGPVDLECMWRY